MDEIENVDASVQFIIDGDNVFHSLYLGKKLPPPNNLAELLFKINSAGYVSDLINLIKNYQKDDPQYKDYLDQVIELWVKKSREKIKESENNGLGYDPSEDELVVAPDMFIKYEGFAGNE